MNFLFRLTSVCFALFFSNFAHGSYRLPVDSFYNRYQLASDIVYGEVVAIEKTKEALPIFKEFSGEDNFRATLRIKKSWKGQKEGEIHFFYNAEKTSTWISTSRSRLKAAKQIHPGSVSVGSHLLLFLREDGGKKIAQTFFGVKFVENHRALNKSHDYLVLEDLRAGKPMKEALARIGPREVKAYEDSLKK